MWDIASNIPQSSLQVLPAPFGGAAVQALARAPYAKDLDLLAVAYGGAPGERGPCLGLWDRSRGRFEPTHFSCYPTPSPFASPTSLTYSADPSAPHTLFVGFDDGTLAEYDDRDLTAPRAVTRPHGPAAVRCLTALPNALLSLGEDGAARLSAHSLAAGAAPLDQRSDYAIAAAVTTTAAGCAVLTGGVDGQVRLFAL